MAHMRCRDCQSQQGLPERSKPLQSECCQLERTSFAVCAAEEGEGQEGPQP